MGALGFRTIFSCVCGPAVLAEVASGAWMHLGVDPSRVSVVKVAASLAYVLSFALGFAWILRRAGKLKALWILWTVVHGVLWVFPGSLKPDQGSPHGLRRVILVTVDTLRQDALSCMNEDAPPTPCMDQWARDGILFEQAMASSSWTLPSLSSVLTGLSPDVHRAIRWNSRIPDKIQTLAEHLRSAGYDTSAVGWNDLLRPASNLSQGFRDYDLSGRGWAGRSFGVSLLRRIVPRQVPIHTDGMVIDRASEWIRKNKDRDFFLWVHLYEPHQPYTPPENMVPSGPVPLRIGTQCWVIEKILSGEFVASDEEKTWIRALYQAEAQYTDKCVGRLMQTLKDLGLYDSSLLVLTSDHGEEFWEHGSVEHGRTLYEEVMRVPLILKVPQGSGGLRLKVPVVLDDLAPTLLDACQVSYDPQSMTGSSFWTPAWKETSEDRPIYMGGVTLPEEMEGIVFDPMKYILCPRSSKEELYDLDADPKEQTSLIQTQPEALKRARELLAQHRLQSERLRALYGIEAGEDAQLDGDVIGNLKNLGYVR